MAVGTVLLPPVCRPERDEKLIEWTASTKPSNLRFKLALGSKQNGCFCICDDGLYFRSGFAIYIAQNEEPIFVPEAFFDGKTAGDAPITTETLAQAYMGTRGTDPSEYVGVNMSLTHDQKSKLL